MAMTERQRDYLADLAGMKGERLVGTDGWGAARASVEIERLKKQDDVEYPDVGEEIDREIDKRTMAAVEEVSRWGFDSEAGGA